MSHKMLRPFIVKVSVLVYFPLHLFILNLHYYILFKKLLIYLCKRNTFPAIFPVFYLLKYIYI